MTEADKVNLRFMLFKFDVMQALQINFSESMVSGLMKLMTPESQVGEQLGSMEEMSQVLEDHTKSLRIGEQIVVGVKGLPFIPLAADKYVPCMVAFRDGGVDIIEPTDLISWYRKTYNAAPEAGEGDKSVQKVPLADVPPELLEAVKKQLPPNFTINDVHMVSMTGAEAAKMLEQLKSSGSPTSLGGLFGKMLSNVGLDLFDGLAPSEMKGEPVAASPCVAAPPGSFWPGLSSKK